MIDASTVTALGAAAGAVTTALGGVVVQARRHAGEVERVRLTADELEYLHGHAERVAESVRRGLACVPALELPPVNARPTRRGSRRRLLAAYARLVVQQAVDDITGELAPAGVPDRRSAHGCRPFGN